NGSDSEYFDFFDNNWTQPYEEMHGRVLAPLLGNFYGRCLENGEIKLHYDETGLTVNYYDNKFPIRIGSYFQFITYNLGHLTRKLGRHHPDYVKLMGILYLLKSIPSEAKGKERYDQINFVKGLLWELYTQNSEVEEFINKNLIEFNGEKGKPETFDLLGSLISDQFYRLAFWKVGAEEINYRRFFTVNELISVKAEEVRVFHKTHELINNLVEEGKITGLRIDHIDGLYNPTEYLERLREKVGDVYITVEKILELEEELPDFWPIQGTSGYDFMNYVNGILCRKQSKHKLEKIYSQFTGHKTIYEEQIIEKKALILEKNLAGDIDNLAQILKRVSSHTREGSDFTLNGLKRTLSEVLILFPVYRTYANPNGIREADQNYVYEVISEAKKRIPLLVNELNFIQKILLLEYEDFRTEIQRKEWLHFVMRFQQLTGPLMAKGVEDTLLYVYSRLLSLNEVGGNPGQFGITLETFHQFNSQKAKQWPSGMNATATHDTKRGEDVRARLNVLAEIPEEWGKQVQEWSEINAAHKNDTIPDPNDEYFFYQTLVGAYPFDSEEIPNFTERVKQYMIKAVREAKVHTAWLHPDNEYEEGFIQFVEKVLKPSQSNSFLQKFLPFQKQVAEYGIYNSLTQVLIKNTVPGVPDLYQGAELWDLSLVDPDNRRPVNYDKRMAVLTDIEEKAQKNVLQLIQELFATKEDGRIKLFVTHRVLQARKACRAIFDKGDYSPLPVSGKWKESVVAFARTYDNNTVVAIAPRFLSSLIQPGELPLGNQVWEDTTVELPQKQWQNAITSHTLEGNKILIGDVLAHFPVALLVS
ncbi:MAG: malto-oligosyltrehalose synthase, partial [Halothece sp.]